MAPISYTIVHTCLGRWASWCYCKSWSSSRWQCQCISALDECVAAPSWSMWRCRRQTSSSDILWHRFELFDNLVLARGDRRTSIDRRTADMDCRQLRCPYRTADRCCRGAQEFCLSRLHGKLLKKQITMEIVRSEIAEFKSGKNLP